MAQAVLVKTVIFDQDLYKSGHMVNRWLGLMTSRFAEHARHYAPERTGRLREGISGEHRQVGERQVEGTIESTAPYTMYVLRGTTGPIMTRKAFANPGGATVTLWGSIDPATKKFTRRNIKGARRVQREVRVKGYYLKIPAYGDYEKFFALSVDGQEAQNFLVEAWRATARNHRSIRGAIPTFITNP